MGKPRRKRRNVDWGFGGGYQNQTFDNYTATNPITIAATERAGIKSSADSADDPYGPNLQPGADMSGTGGTTSGVGTVNGDVADDWGVYAVSGATATVSKTANDYQRLDTAGGSSVLRGTTETALITTDEVWVAECYVSGMTATPPALTVRGLTGLNQQFSYNLSNGYTRVVFTADATFYGTCYFVFTDGEGCTIHWTRLRKLSGENCIITELDRTLRAGTNIYTSDFSTDEDGFTNANGTVVGDIDAIGSLDDNLRFTCDTANGIHIISKSAFTVGKRYRVRFRYYIPSGQSNIDGLLVYSLASFSGQLSALDTWTDFDQEITADGSNLRFFATDGGSASFTDAGGDDVFYLREVKIDPMQPTITTTKRVNYVETVLDTSYVDVLGTEEWDGDDPITAGNDDKLNSFVSLGYDVGDIFELKATLSGRTTGFAYIIDTSSGYVGLTVLSGDPIVSSDGTYIIIAVVNDSSKTIKIRNGTDGTISDISFKKIGPRDLVTVKDGTNFNVFYNNTKITEETISDASVIYNKLHSSYGDSTAAATIERLTSQYATGSVAQADMRLSAVDGTAFIDFGAADVLTDRIGKQIYIFDSAGKQAVGWIKAAGTGETYDSELITNTNFEGGDVTGWTKYQTRLDTFEINSTNPINGVYDAHLAETGASAGANIYESITTVSGGLYKFLSTMKLNSGDYINFKLGDGVSITSLTLFQYLLNSVSTKSYIRYYTPSITTAYVLFGANNINFDANIDDISAKQVLTPSATGATIVSASGGATYNWSSIEAGFDYNDASGYTYVILQ